MALVGGPMFFSNNMHINSTHGKSPLLQTRRTCIATHMIFNKSVTVDGVPRNMVTAQQATYKKIRYISNIFFTTIVFKLLSHELCIAKTEGFKGSTCKFTLSGGEIPHIGRYGGLIWHNWFQGFWMHKQSVRLVQVEDSR